MEQIFREKLKRHHSLQVTELRGLCPLGAARKLTRQKHRVPCQLSFFWIAANCSSAFDFTDFDMLVSQRRFASRRQVLVVRRR